MGTTREGRAPRCPRDDDSATTLQKERTMQNAQGTKLGLLALLKVSHSLKGHGEVQVFARMGLLGRMMGWARRR